MTASPIHVNRTDVLRWRAGNILYSFLFLLPVIWIQDKTVQMVIEIAVLVLMLVIERKPDINRMTIPVLLYAAVHIFSILVNICTSKEPIDNSRIVAAFNTAFVWILGSMVFSAVIRIKLDTKKIIRLMTYLYWVIIFECLLAIVASSIEVKVDVNNRSLYKYEWFNESDRIRSFCWMEYASLVPFLLFCVLPYVYIGINKEKPIIRIAVMAASVLPLYLCNSRLGLVLVLALVGYMSIVEMWKHKVLKVALLALCFVGLAFGLIKIDLVMEKVSSLLNKLIFGRQASNETRTMLYGLTWEKAKETSLLFGAGIKYITVISEIPLGSHSTYLGAIYKAGMIGAVFLFSFLANMARTTWKMVSTKKLNMIFLVSLLGIYALLIMEDIDGANWMHFFFFIHLGIMIRIGNEKRNHFKKCSWNERMKREIRR